LSKPSGPACSGAAERRSGRRLETPGWAWRYSIRPGVNSAREAAHVGESGPAQNLHRFCNDLATGIEFLHALRQLGQRNQLSADVGDLVFVFLADVEQG
jgi:hypothetical protein